MSSAAAGVWSPLLHAQPASGSPEIRARLTPAGEPYRARVVATMQEAGARYAEWLGPLPAGALTITDRPRLGPPMEPQGWVPIDLPAWSAPRTMDVEAEVAYGLARQWWPSLLANPDSAPLVNGAAWYLQSRVVEQLFDRQFLSIAHSADGVRYFGGSVPWAFRSLVLGRSTAGLGRAEFLRGGQGQARWPASGRRLPSSLDPAALRGALAFGTLERYLTWPALQGALHAWASRAAAGLMSRADIIHTIGAAAGQDLSWLFDPVVEDGHRFDYALGAFSVEPGPKPCGGGPCYLTRITAARTGDAQFTGTSRPQSGPYESGDAMTLNISFADGRELTARWDGRQASKTFEFESASPAVAARLDPDRVLLLDENHLDDARLVNAATNVPVGKWVARWVVWLQDAMLAYSF